MAVNLPKIADASYLSLHCNSTKQNDNITMTFSVNSGLQCLRTAALSMVTLNMDSRNPTGRVYAENRSKTQKLLGVKGLIRISVKHVPFLIAFINKATTRKPAMRWNFINNFMVDSGVVQVAVSGVTV